MKVIINNSKSKILDDRFVITTELFGLERNTEIYFNKESFINVTNPSKLSGQGSRPDIMPFDFIVENFSKIIKSYEGTVIQLGNQVEDIIFIVDHLGIIKKLNIIYKKVLIPFYVSINNKGLIEIDLMVYNYENIITQITNNIKLMDNRVSDKDYLDIISNLITISSLDVNEELEDDKENQELLRISNVRS